MTNKERGIYRSYLKRQADRVSLQSYVSPLLRRLIYLDAAQNEMPVAEFVRQIIQKKYERKINKIIEEVRSERT